MIKNGTGTLTLTGANSYTSPTLINQGTVNIQNATGLGSNTPAVIVASGATLQLQGGIAVGAKPFTLAGTLENLAGTNSWSGAVTLAAASTVSVDVGTLTLSGVISGAGDLSKTGGGTLVLSGAANTFTGQLSINAGILDVALTAASNANFSLGANTSPVVVASGATLQFDVATNAPTVAGKPLVLNGTGFGQAEAGAQIHGTGALANATGGLG